jgi:hypothetical protein
VWSFVGVRSCFDGRSSTGEGADGGKAMGDEDAPVLGKGRPVGRPEPRLSGVLRGLGARTQAEA